MHTMLCGCATNLYSLSDAADAAEEAHTPFDPGPHHPAFYPECKATVTGIDVALRMQQFYPGARVQVFDTSDTHAANGSHVEGSITVHDAPKDGEAFWAHILHKKYMYQSRSCTCSFRRVRYRPCTSLAMYTESRCLLCTRFDTIGIIMMKSEA